MGKKNRTVGKKTSKIYKYGLVVIIDIIVVV